MSRLSEKLLRGELVITSEIGPPKGTNVQKCLEEAEHVRHRVTAINVTDLQSAAMRLGSMVTCHLLLDRGIEPVFQMVCRDRNRLALQSDLLSASCLGIENVLCPTGDHTTLGDDPNAKPVFDLDSVSLLHAATTLMQGKDLAGNELDGSPKFFLGAVVTPGANPLEPQLIKMEKKIAAGARFFQTQAVYDVAAFERFMNEAKPFGTKVLAGIVILKSVGMARYMNENVAGVNVPEHLIDELKKNKEKTKSGQTGVEIAARLIRDIKDLCDGIHLMPLGWDDKVPQILDLAGL
jgi:5,10-methylenetetrahydrofolate reductase